MNYCTTCGMETRRHSELCDDCISKVYIELSDLTSPKLTDLMDEDLDVELLKMEREYNKYL